jgi:hypothetical protein
VMGVTMLFCLWLLMKLRTMGTCTSGDVGLTDLSWLTEEFKKWAQLFSCPSLLKENLRRSMFYLPQTIQEESLRTTIKKCQDPQQI